MLLLGNDFLEAHAACINAWQSGRKGHKEAQTGKERVMSYE